MKHALGIWGQDARSSSCQNMSSREPRTCWHGGRRRRCGQCSSALVRNLNASPANGFRTLRCCSSYAEMCVRPGALCHPKASRRVTGYSCRPAFGAGGCTNSDVPRSSKGQIRGTILLASQESNLSLTKGRDARLGFRRRRHLGRKALKLSGRLTSSLGSQTPNAPRANSGTDSETNS